MAPAPHEVSFKWRASKLEHSLPSLPQMEWAEEWEKIYSKVLRKNKSELDLSISHIDGSHAPALHGGEMVEYQGRKKSRTTNALFLSDNEGIPLAMSRPQVDNHSVLNEIEEGISELMAKLSKGVIPNICQPPVMEDRQIRSGSMTRRCTSTDGK